MTKAYDDLMAAFGGESKANRKYTAYATKADEEGFPQVARLFRAAAAGETVHALNHFRAADEVKSTQENLADAIAGEH
ncbi:rubrerythrin family protein, partial [bacterium]|nr:rubrerythrin family protein [bacterium]